VVRERLQGAQEAVRLHAERVRAQAKDIGFLQAQLDKSREAERELRILMAQGVTAQQQTAAALNGIEERPALPAPRRSRWLFWRR
jgi:hypothetical protein